MQIFSYTRRRGRQLLPLALSLVEAGFPSPAEGQIDEGRRRERGDEVGNNAFITDAAGRFFGRFLGTVHLFL